MQVLELLPFLPFSSPFLPFQGGWVGGHNVTFLKVRYFHSVNSEYKHNTAFYYRGKNWNFGRITVLVDLTKHRRFELEH